jgi:starch synthase
VSAPINVWHVTREYAGIAEAGGVKDMVRGLAEAQARSDVTPSVVLPRYGFIPNTETPGTTVALFSLQLPDQDRGNARIEEQVRVTSAERNGVRLLFVDAPRFAAARDVYTYTAQDEEENRWRKRGTGHWDSHQLNLTVQKAALEAAIALGEIPDIYHCHDGHTAFLPALMREDARYQERFARTSAVLTIHNAGAGYHQEVWDPLFARLLTGLPEGVLEKGMLNGTVDPLLLAGGYASLATVSEQYARELLEERDREMSGGLGKTLRERGVPITGITNGIDPEPWDPRPSGAGVVPFGFDPLRGDLDGKRRCRRALMERLHLQDLPEPDRCPLYAFVGRLTGQKGIEVLLEALRVLIRTEPGRRFVILGQGEQEKEAMLSRLAAEPFSAGRLAFVPRYDAALATLIYAASDFFLIPSAYEPCGLTDYIAQLLGSIPIVHRVGGLVKVRDGETGFSYDMHVPAALVSAVERTTALFRGEPQTLERIRRTAFAEIFSMHTWDRVFSEGYRPLYQAAVSRDAWTRK